MLDRPAACRRGHGSDRPHPPLPRRSRRYRRRDRRGYERPRHRGGRDRAPSSRGRGRHLPLPRGPLDGPRPRAAPTRGRRPPPPRPTARPRPQVRRYDLGTRERCVRTGPTDRARRPETRRRRGCARRFWWSRSEPALAVDALVDDHRCAIRFCHRSHPRPSGTDRRDRPRDGDGKCVRLAARG